MRVAVDLVIQRDGETLFIKRKFPPFERMLALPGGFVEEGEAVEAAALREVREETGVACLDERDLVLIGVYSRTDRDPRGRVISIAFKCEVPAGTRAQAGDDADEAAWMCQDRAAEIGLAFDHAEIIRDAGL